MSNKNKNKSTADIKRRSASIFDAKTRKSAGFMGDRRKKRSKERQDHQEGW